MRFLPLLLLCACNQVFGLHKTKQRLPDGAAKPDPMCTTGMLPTFGVSSHVVISRSCTSYSPSESIDLALSSCAADIYAGAVDSDTVVHLPLPATNGDVFSDARLAPEGDRLIAKRTDAVGQPQGYELFDFIDGVWTHDITLPFPITTVIDVGIPSRFGVGAHVMCHEIDGLLHERIDDGTGSWPERFTYDPVTLTGDASAYVRMGSLTPDGLRLVLRAQLLAGDGPTQMMYLERSSIGVAFTGPGVTLAVPGQVGESWPYLTENCGKLYYSDDATIYVSEQ